MKILFDIGHPAHVHFFYNPIKILIRQGHNVLVTSRTKDIATELLDNLDLQHKVLSEVSKKSGVMSLMIELIYRDIKLSQIVNEFRPDIMAGIGGIFIAHVGKIKNIPSLVFYDTENATLQNALTYPFASCVIVPECYQAWLPDKRHVKYSGYHEIAYLRPNRFSPNYDIAVKNGLSSSGDTFLLRLVSWQANHDIGENGWSLALLKQVVNKLKNYGKVIISSESTLPDELIDYSYSGEVAEIHHVMAFCKGFIGESATMASESAVLGVPAVYAAETGRGYTDEQEKKYGLVKNIRDLNWNDVESGINWLLSIDKASLLKAHGYLLNNTVDVTEFVVNCILKFPSCLHDYQYYRNP